MTGVALARRTDLPVVSSPPAKNNSFREQVETAIEGLPSRASSRGAFRDRHGRWVRDAMDAGARLTGARFADGEVVWSRYPDADIKLATMLSHRAGDGGKKARLTGESTKETVKTIARGMPGDSGVTVVTTLACFFQSHVRLRAQCERPAFPAPSDVGAMFERTRADRAAGTRIYASRHCERSEAIHFST
jgi:hypothetical protein